MGGLRNRRLLESIERHMARGNLHMERGNELMDGVREEIRLSRELHADLRLFMRETSLRPSSSCRR